MDRIYETERKEQHASVQEARQKSKEENQH
jgi:hypothetical protein